MTINIHLPNVLYCIKCYIKICEIEITFSAISTRSCLFSAADQSRIMQDQMTGAAMAMPPDPNKAFKVSRTSFA